MRGIQYFVVDTAGGRFLAWLGRFAPRGRERVWTFVSCRHCEERSDEAIHSFLAAWIASLTLAMTRLADRFARTRIDGLAGDRGPARRYGRNQRAAKAVVLHALIPVAGSDQPFTHKSATRASNIRLCWL
jgi:hypothetical protein